MLADYTPDSQQMVNARLSYTRESNSLITTSDLSGLTGRLMVNWQPTAKITVVCDTSWETG